MLYCIYTVVHRKLVLRITERIEPLSDGVPWSIDSITPHRWRDAIDGVVDSSLSPLVALTLLNVKYIVVYEIIDVIMWIEAIKVAIETAVVCGVDYDTDNIDDALMILYSAAC